MVEFEYQPWEKIIIHEIVEYPMEFFFTQATLGIPEGGVGRPLNWSNGIVFINTVVQPTEDVIKEQLKGIIHWASLYFGRMRKYQKEIKRERSVTVTIIDLSNHSVFGPMAKWLKEVYKTKET